MKLHRYKNFIRESKEDIDSICKMYRITNYTINEDRTIDVDGDVFLDHKGLTELPLKFGKVSGYFGCSNNQLTNLSGSPSEVGRGFYCNDNRLTSLEGMPQYTKRIINCRNNHLRDVKGVPDGWRGKFRVIGNPVYEIFKLFPDERRDEVIEHLNEYNVIRDGKVVIMQAIERVFWELDLEVPEIEEIEGYEIHF
jgi:hypothetical protein